MKLWLSGHVNMNVSQVIRDFRPQSQKGFMLKTVVGKIDVGDRVIYNKKCLSTKVGSKMLNVELSNKSINTEYADTTILFSLKKIIIKEEKHQNE